MALFESALSCAGGMLGGPSRRAGVALLSVACLLAAGCSSEQQETRYKTRAAAEAAGAVHQGWIPEWLPKNAYNLKEKHDLDTNRSILRFNFPAAQEWIPSSDCSPVAPSQVRKPGMEAAWWPAGLPALSEDSPRYVYYACASGVFLAVDTLGGEGFHWRP